jgi:hypothetical protein
MIHAALTTSDNYFLCLRNISHNGLARKCGYNDLSIDSKKLDLRGVRQPPGIVLRRRPSHTGQENTRTPAPPIHSGIEAHVRTTTTGAEP